MNKIFLEVCCGSLKDAKAAYWSKADRIELNSALTLGGLTPSFITMEAVKSECEALPVMAMVRPRAGGFCYDDTEYDIMTKEAKALIEKGADGIVFGCLNEDKTIDYNKTKGLLDIAHKENRVAVFHRAIDVVPDIDKAMETLIEIGFDRVLTSGQKRTAPKGSDNIKYLNKTYGDKIEILPGSGIRSENAIELIEKTGVTQIHSSCKSWFLDKTANGEDVSFDIDSERENMYDGVSLEEVLNIMEVIK